MDLLLSTGERIRNLGWMYWLPNPLFPFIWVRVAVPQMHPETRWDLRVVRAYAAQPEVLRRSSPRA